MYEQWKIADEYSDAGEIVVGDGPKLFSTDHRCYPEGERSWLSLRSQLWSWSSDRSQLLSLLSAFPGSSRTKGP